MTTGKQVVLLNWDYSEYVKLQQHLQRARKAGKPATLTIEEWKQTVLDFGGLCAYCQQSPLQAIEHFIPVDIAGTHVGNCVPACATCNSRKHRRMGADLIFLFGEETINRITQYLSSHLPRKSSSRKEKLMEVIEQQQRILTTQQIADAYGTDVKTISYNFNYNKDHYTESKHYYCLEGEELKKFKTDCSGNSRIVEPRAASLYLWTEAGALMHAKSLNTDKAWEVYEQLVETYFRYKDQNATQAQEQVLHHQEQQNLDAGFMAAIADTNRRKLLMAGLEKDR